MVDTNTLYKKFIDNAKSVSSSQISRGNFYLIKQYEYANGEKGKFSESEAPIIFVLYVSKAKDIIHAVKITEIVPKVVKSFLAKFVNKKTEKFEMRGGAKMLYKEIVSKAPGVTSDAYRTYNLSGFRSVLELKMDLNELTPKNVKVKDDTKK
jgi:hypothetical protein